MYIVPIAVRERAPGVKQVSILLERNGTHLMSLDFTGNSPIHAAKEFAEANGLALESEPVHAESLIFLPVDSSRTDFSAFYSWREVPPGTIPSKEVWRSFVWVTENLGVNICLQQIILAEPAHSVYSLLTTYL